MFQDANISNKYIEVDGGINAQTAPIVRSAGANVLVSGNAIYSLQSQVEIKNIIEIMKS